MTKQDVINHINNSIGASSPFDTDAAFTIAEEDELRKKWFYSIDIETLFAIMVEIVKEQPLPFWHDRKDMYDYEICKICSLFNQTSYSNKFLS